MHNRQAAAVHNDHVIPVDVKKVRRFLSNCLRSLGYEQIATPGDLKKVTAVLKHNISGMAANWQYRYDVTIRYRQQADGSTILDYEVFDAGIHKGGTATCSKMLNQLVENLSRDAHDHAEITAAEEPVTTHGAARFAEEEDLLAAGYITEHIQPDRLLLAPYPGNRYLTIPKAQTCWHALICGPTGSGKTSGFFVPNIVSRHDSSCIITEATAGDETPELYSLTAGWRKHTGSSIYFFNPGFARGTRINPLDKLKLVEPDEFAAVADELAQLVIVNTTPPTTQRADPIWDKAEKHLLWILIMHVASSGDPELAHFGAIREMLRKPEKVILASFSNSKSDIAREELDSFLAHSSENFRHGVFAGLLQRLNPWLTDRVVTMTKTTDLDLDKLRQELFAFYVSVPSRKAHLKPIGALVFNFLLDLALETRFDHPLALILDEFTNFGAIPGIDDALSIIRKRKLPVVLGVQTFKQIEKLYGRDIAGTIVSQLATRVFFRPRHRETAHEISRELGMKTVVRTDTSDTGLTTIREFGQPLMSESDLTTLPEGEVIVMTPTTYPLKLKRFNFDSFPAPDFEVPRLPEHRVQKGGEFLPQAVASERAADAKKKANISQEERDFVKHKEKVHQELEEQRRKKQPINLDEEDWNIP